MKNGFAGIVLILFIIAGIGITGGSYFIGKQVALRTQKQFVGGDRDEHGCIGSAGYSWCEVKQKCLREWEEPCAVNSTAPTSLPTTIATQIPTVDEKSAIIQDVRQALAAEHGTDANSYNITVSKIVGDYASGGASGSGGGGMWFVAKNGVWKIVWNGNGVIMCSDLTAYPNFPTSLIPECYNDQTQKTVKR